MRANCTPASKHLGLRVGARFDQPELLQEADQRRHPVIAQPAGMEARRHEGRTERVHLDQRRQMPGVAEIIGVFAARQARAGRRLAGDDAQLAAAAQPRADEREGDAGEIAAAAGAADDDVGIVAGHLELRHRLLADDRLVQQHVVEHAAERVFGVGVLRGDLDRLADGDAQAAGRIRMFGQDAAGRHWSRCWGWRRIARPKPPSARAVGLLVED